MPLTIYSTTSDVAIILGSNYGPQSDGTSPDLAPYLRKASLVMARVLACAIYNKGDIPNADELEDMAKWLAAYYYTIMDPVYLSRSTASASGSFATDADRYKNAAMDTDPSGCLRTILSGATAGMFWAGKTETEQIDYDERN